jgi:hypothetical protein
MAFTVTTILAPTGATIPIVFVADGFKSSQMSTFDDNIDDIMIKFRTTAPFNTSANKGKFQWYKVSKASVQDGVSIIDHPENPMTPVTRNTFFKIFRNWVGLSHYYHIPDYNRAILASGLLDSPGGFFANRPNDNVFVIIISNSSTYGGGAEFLGLMPSTSSPDRMSICIVGNGDDMTDVAIHEFGHSFGDLDDEYLDSVYAANAPTYEPDVWFYGNRLNVRDANPGGWYQGARYVTTKYRATYDDLMKNIYASGFGSPNEALLQDRIDDEA